MTTVVAAAHRRGTWIGAATIFLAATAIAATMSPSVSLWTDEAVTISAAQRSLGELWALVQRIDAVHALYYALMSTWVDIAGASAFTLRLPSALAAGATAVGVFFLARELTTPRTAFIAGAVSATLPRLAWGGIEARPFIFSALLAVWTTFLLVRAIRRTHALAWTLYALVATIGVAVNIYLVMLIVAHAFTVAALARRERRTIIGFSISAVSVALISSPLLLLVRSQQAQLGGEGDRNPLSIARKILINQFFLGETPDPEEGARWFTIAWQSSAIIAAALGLSAMLLAILRRSRDGDDKRSVLAVTIPWILLPTLLVAGYAVLVSPIYQPRYFTFTAPAAAILIALGVRSIGRRWYAAVGIAAYIACILVVLVSQRTPFAKSGADWSAVAQVVAEQSRAGDGVYFAPRYADQTDVVDMTTRRIAVSYPEGFQGLDDLTLVETGAQSATLDGFSLPISETENELSTLDRVWAVFNRKSFADVRSESEALFAELGFTPRLVWDGPSTIVVLYSQPD